MNKLEIVSLTKTYNHKNANENINLTLEEWSLWFIRTKWSRKDDFNEANCNT